MKNNFKFLLTILLLFFAASIVYTQDKQPQKQDEQSIESNKPDVPVKILKMPRANSDTRCIKWNKRRGTVFLRATFDESGKVTNPTIINSSSCSYFDENAIEAALKIQFKPALKNGKPMTVSKVLQYNWSAR